jgi:gamma-glutamyltranspeptidase / glutathione hydrolase
MLSYMLLLWWYVALALATDPIENDKRGAVASEVNVCSEIGITILKVGGNAADAVS